MCWFKMGIAKKALDPLPPLSNGQTWKKKCPQPSWQAFTPFTPNMETTHLKKGLSLPCKACEICCSTVWCNAAPPLSALDRGSCSHWKSQVLLSVHIWKCVFFVSGIVWVGLYRKADQIMTAAGQLLYFLLIGIRVFIWRALLQSSFDKHPYLHSILGLRLWRALQK